MTPCHNCGTPSRVTFHFRNGFECCAGCQAEYRRQCEQNRRDAEREQQAAVERSEAAARRDAQRVARQRQVQA